jgi:hypothetical protein
MRIISVCAGLALCTFSEKCYFDPEILFFKLMYTKGCQKPVKNLFFGVKLFLENFM